VAKQVPTLFDWLGGAAALDRLTAPRHFARHLTEAQRRRWVSLLIDTADEIELPADPEFRSALMAYLEWGTRIAVINSQLEPHAVEQEPMPLWGWGEVRGPYEAG